MGLTHKERVDLDNLFLSTKNSRDYLKRLKELRASLFDIVKPLLRQKMKYGKR
jgi:hypothetical protein